MAPVLYVVPESPAVEAVLITAKAIGLRLHIKELNFETNDHLSPAFRKINPQCTVPLLDDSGRIIADSHAIIIYLVEKYSKDDSLYPKDVYHRALINQRLHFDSGILCPLLTSVSLLEGTLAEVQSKTIEDIKRSYAVLEQFLSGNRWITGDSVTVADFSLVTSVMALKTFMELDVKIYPNLVAWTKRSQLLPCFTCNDWQANGTMS